MILCDNSGGRIIKCISLKNSYKTFSIGKIFKGAIQRLRKKRKSKSKVKKGKLYPSLLIQTRCIFFRQSNKSYQCNSNLSIVIGKNNEPLATRVFNGIPKESRTQRKSKLFLIAPFIY